MSLDLTQGAELYDGHTKMVHLQAGTHPRTSPFQVKMVVLTLSSEHEMIAKFLCTSTRAVLQKLALLNVWKWIKG